MDAILQALQTGLPVLVVQLAVTLALLAIGVVLYMAVTPFHELRLVRGGNVAAGLAFAGALVGLAIPLAATLATSLLTLDILVWGAVAIVVQILAFLLASRLVGGMRDMIEANNAAGACVLVGVQLAVALLNAAAMSG